MHNESISKRSEVAVNQIIRTIDNLYIRPEKNLDFWLNYYEGYKTLHPLGVNSGVLRKTSFIMDPDIRKGETASNCNYQPGTEKTTKIGRNSQAVYNFCLWAKVH